MDPHLLQALDYLFGITNGDREKVSLAASAGLSFPSIYILMTKEQWPMKGQKETSRTYCKRSWLLSVFGQYREDAPLSKVPRHLHLVNCFQEGMLEFDGSYWAVFQQMILFCVEVKINKCQKSITFKSRNSTLVAVTTKKTYGQIAVDKDFK